MRGRRYSANLEDRRDWPEGVGQFTTEDNWFGDMTFHPPMVDPHTEPNIIPYSDPEGEYNQERLRQRFREDFGMANPIEDIIQLMASARGAPSVTHTADPMQMLQQLAIGPINWPTASQRDPRLNSGGRTPTPQDLHEWEQFLLKNPNAAQAG